MLAYLRRLVKAHPEKEIREDLQELVPLLGEYLSLAEQQEDIFLNLTLSERRLTSESVIQTLKDFLGRIGGLSHYVVPSLKALKGQAEQPDLIAWDYDARLSLEVTLSTKRV